MDIVNDAVARPMAGGPFLKLKLEMEQELETRWNRLAFAVLDMFKNATIIMKPVGPLRVPTDSHVDIRMEDFYRVGSALERVVGKTGHTGKWELEDDSKR